MRSVHVFIDAHLSHSAWSLVLRPKFVEMFCKHGVPAKVTASLHHHPTRHTMALSEWTREMIGGNDDAMSVVLTPARVDSFVPLHVDVKHKSTVVTTTPSSVVVFCCPSGEAAAPYERIVDDFMANATTCAEVCLFTELGLGSHLVLDVVRHTAYVPPPPADVLV